jgi:SAM-dependent methyltransferase
MSGASRIMTSLQQTFAFDTSGTSGLPPPEPTCEALADELARWVYGGRPTAIGGATVSGPGGQPLSVPTFVNEFWTSRQRAAHRLHEVSYRACFKPQLPRFFLERLTRPGDRVYDPFMGRGTTLLEAALHGRQVAGCDVNPLSRILREPRLEPPDQRDVEARLAGIDLDAAPDGRDDLEVFYHPDTLRALRALRAWLLERAASGRLDAVDRWIRMIAVNRLTGHSPGFFSVYTLPPNQAVSIDAQRKLNASRGQAPPRRDVRALILRKSRQLLAGCDSETRETLARAAGGAVLVTARAHHTPQLPDGSVSLVVTSPPFLDVVNYAGDNWLRCWFCGIDAGSVEITMARTVEAWQAAMAEVFDELHRVVRPGGHVAFEVGEVRGGAVRLEEAVIPAAARAGFEPALVLINAQDFTKTANCWGVTNNSKGTNTNRVVLLRRA